MNIINIYIYIFIYLYVYGYMLHCIVRMDTAIMTAYRRGAQYRNVSWPYTYTYICIYNHCFHPLRSGERRGYCLDFFAVIAMTAIRDEDPLDMVCDVRRIKSHPSHPVSIMWDKIKSLHVFFDSRTKQFRGYFFSFQYIYYSKLHYMNHQFSVLQFSHLILDMRWKYKNG